MIERLKPWWGQRTLREQRLLIAMAALLAVTILWLGLVRPMDGALADARARHGRAVLALGEARGRAEAIRRLEGRPAPALPIPLPAFVQQQASEAGFDRARVEPRGGGGAAITIDAVRPPAFFGWIAMLEQRHGLLIDRLVARTNADATLSVQAELRVRGR